MICTVADFLPLSSSRKVTDQGFLVAPGTLARAGVQAYRAGELGLADRSAESQVRLYRSADTLGEQACIDSFTDKPITLGHPDPSKYPEGVTKDNWKELARGHVNRVKMSDGKLRGTLHITDGAAIEAVKSGKTQLSNGYSFNLDMTAGVTDGGEEYDGVQTNIRGNHLAIVDIARGGKDCRIADRGEQPMATKTVVVDGVSLTLAEAEAKHLESVLKAADAASVEMRALKTKVEESTKALDEATAEISKLKGLVVSDAQIQALVADRASVLADCAKRCPSVKAEGSTLEIRRAMLAEVTAKSEAAKRIGDAVIPAGDITTIPEATIKTALDAIFAAVDVSVNDHKAHNTQVAAALTSTVAVDGTAKGQEPTKGKAEEDAEEDASANDCNGRAAYVKNLTKGKKSSGDKK